MHRVKSDLKTYIEENVLPVYSLNDKGHGIEHINYVLHRCFVFETQFKNIDPDI